MQKRDTLGTASAASLTEAYRCSECLHFRNHPHSTREQACSAEEVKANAIAPKCFTPDITRLFGNSDQFVQLASLFHSYKPDQKRALVALLRQKKRGYVLGTKLYFRIGKDFVSNYLAGYVAGYASSGELLLIGSPDNNARGQSFMTILTGDDDGILTVSQWKAKREQLQAQNLIFDPSNKIVKKSSVVDDYEPPTLDTVPSYVYHKEEAPEKKVRRRVIKEIDFNVS